MKEKKTLNALTNACEQRVRNKKKDCKKREWLIDK